MMTTIPGSSASYLFDIDPQNELALVCTSGTLTGEDMREIVAAIHADSRWASHFDAIWDCRRVVSHAVRPSEVVPVVREIVEKDAIVDELTGRDVMIEADGIVDSAISHLIAVLCRREGKDVRVVSTMDEALVFLDHDRLPHALQSLTEAG